MKNPFLKYVMKEKKEDIFHSSAYGKAQNGGTMGAASVESFEERMKVDKNRQIVRGYNDSRVANGMYANGPRAKQYVPPEKKDGIPGGVGVGGKGASTPIPAPGKPAMQPAHNNFAPTIKPNFGK